MIRFSILLSLLLSSTASLAQIVQGIVVDENATPISYVNIGIMDYPNGTLSDSSGRFELSLPDSLDRNLNVSFSHLSYVTVERTIAETHRLNSSGEPLEITMSSRIIGIEGIVVRPSAKKHRYVKRGFPIPGYGSFTFEEGETGSELGESIGSRLNIESRVRVSKIEFTVLSNTYTNVKLRINAYKVNPQTALPENILQNPMYYDIIPGKKKQKIEVVPVEDIVLVEGEYLFTLEFVEHEGDGELRFPLFLRKSYYRPSSMEQFEELPVNIGIAVEGVEIANE